MAGTDDPSGEPRNGWPQRFAVVSTTSREANPEVCRISQQHAVPIALPLYLPGVFLFALGALNDGNEKEDGTQKMII